MIKNYIEEIASITRRGDAREESYYRALADLLEEFSLGELKKTVHVTTLPKKTEAGNPDFRVWDGKRSIVGYLEAKTPNAHLDEIEESEQLRRYRKTFANLILTNFYEFKLYRHGECKATVQLARPFIPTRLKVAPPVEHEEEFSALLRKFFDFSRPKTYTAESLAKELATLTRFLRDEIIAEQLKEEHSRGEGTILGFYEAFRQHLIADLTHETFADLYAQTLTYGLFAARTRSDKDFNRKLAYTLIPKTIGILRDIFRFISVEDPPPQLEWIVDDIAEVLAVADVRALLDQFYEEGKGTDPIFHFYETFLSQYNPEEREQRGVYYTPIPVVSYIVQSLNLILKDRFGRSDGFASPSVTVLDPAGGTLTFIAEASRLAVQEFVEKYGKGSRSKFVQEHILAHFFAFELMMAPYAAGHLKMGLLLEELGHKLRGDERFQFFLTNTLEMVELAQTSLPGMSSLSQESRLAGKVKKEQPILVVLGNPPYSGHSLNKGAWITEQIESFKMVDGKPLGEKNPKWLQDDYVKFIRFAQWKIDQIGEGAVGLITNHSYLDNPTFRGMRQSLMNSFDEICILNLHGNSLRKEKAPDGSKDENVFDIKQGVAIGLFIRRKGKAQKVVRHAELWGLRERKYEWLRTHHIEKTEWEELKPRKPLYLFVQRDEMRSNRFDSYPSVQSIFPVNSVGIVTARDHLTIHWTPEQVWTTILNFLALNPEMARQTYLLGPDARDWKVTLAQEDLRRDGPNRENIVPLLYRPFDVRYTYYTGHSKGFHCMPRGEVMRHMLQPNYSLVLPRRVETDIPWSHALVSNTIVEHVAVSLKTIDYCLPLYVYPDRDKHDLFSQHESAERMPNIAPKLMEALKATYKERQSPEDIFHYIYAVLYSNAYRKKYEELLRTDFPHVPFTRELKLFRKLADKGEQLAQLHLLKSKQIARPIAKCQGSGDLSVIKVTYDGKKGRVYINPQKYFAGIPRGVWEYQIGGYQVADKWLKDRKRRKLTAEEVMHYCRVVTALAKTMQIQESLDKLFEAVEKSLLDLNR